MWYLSAFGKCACEGGDGFSLKTGTIALTQHGLPARESAFGFSVLVPVGVGSGGLVCCRAQEERIVLVRLREPVRLVPLWKRVFRC